MGHSPIAPRGIVLAIRFIRAFERALPVWAIWALCWPVGACWAAWRLTPIRQTVRQFDRLPSALWARPDRLTETMYVWREHVRINMVKFLCLWPDRLCHGRWAAHCRSTGLERLKHYRGQGRPVVLVSLHFGPLFVLCHWLRAHGLPAAVLRERPTFSRPPHLKFIDGLARPDGRAEAPSVFDLSELRKAIEHLKTGGMLAITVDGRNTRHVRLQGEGFQFEMATGPLRIAAASGAVVVPCILTADPYLCFTMHLGEPVPEELVSGPARHQAACDHILRELLEVVKRHPGQSQFPMFESFHPPGPGAAPTEGEVLATTA